MIRIENKQLVAEFSEHGAETQSIRDARTGREYLWQGDARWWDGRSPILFPITGGLWNGTSRIGGKPFLIPKHGYVASREWSVAEQGADYVVFAYEGTEAEREVFPYDYRLSVRYQLEGNTLRADICVENKGEEAMYFQLGGHPGIMLPDFKEEEPIDGFMRFEGKPEHLLRAGEQGCIEVEQGTLQPKHFPIPMNEKGLVPLCEETFANEALILEEQIAAAVVIDKQGKEMVRVASGAPVWLFWSQQNQHCPYVCCEPWYGLPDLQTFEGDISERAYIQSAPAGGRWKGWYSVEIL